MTRFPWTTAAALAGLGLFCGCAGSGANTTSCGEPREGFFTRMMSGFRGGRHEGQCPCVETGRVTVGDGPVVPEPGCCSSGCGSAGLPVQEFPSQGFPSTSFPSQGYPASVPVVPTMPPPTALPLPGGTQAQPIPASPSSAVKDAAK